MTRRDLVRGWLRPTRFDPVALVAGLFFVTIALLYLLDAGGAVHTRPVVTLALAVVGIGATGLVGAVWALVHGHQRAPRPRRGPRRRGGR